MYRALNWATGETVAVKEIQLANIPKAELGEIMVRTHLYLHMCPTQIWIQSEIDLLKNLNVGDTFRRNVHASLSPRLASEHRQVQRICEDKRVSLHHPRVRFPSSRCWALASKPLPGSVRMAPSMPFASGLASSQRTSLLSTSPKFWKGLCTSMTRASSTATLRVRTSSRTRTAQSSWRILALPVRLLQE